MARKGWLEFAQGYGLGQRMVNDYRDSQKKKEIKDVMSQQETPAFTAEQDTARTAMANAKDEQGNPIYNFSADEQGNVSTTLNQQAVPGAAPEAYEPVSVAQKGVSFLGKSYDAPLTEGQRSGAQNSALAGVLAKHGDIEGSMRVRRDAKQEAQGDQRFEWEKGRNEREQRQGAKDEEYQAGRQAAFDGSVFGQKNAEFAQQLQVYSQSKKDYDAALAAGKQPQELGVPPQAPSRPAYTIADSLADQGTLLSHDAKFGKVDAKTFGDFTERMRKLEDEGYTKALTLAQGGATIEQVAQAFNASGQVKFDPKALVSDKMMPGKAGGPPERVISFKDEKGNVQTLNIMSELKSVGKANEVLTQFYAAEGNRRGNNQDVRAGNADARAANSDGRSAASFNESRTDKATLRTANVAYERARQAGDDTGMKAATLAIIQAGGNNPGAASANEPAEVKLARAALQSNVPGVTDMASALEWAKTKNGMSQAEVRRDIYGKALTANFGNAANAQAATDESMKYLFPSAAKPVATFANGAEADAAQKAGKIKPGDKVMIGGRAATAK